MKYENIIWTTHASIGATTSRPEISSSLRFTYTPTSATNKIVLRYNLRLSQGANFVTMFFVGKDVSNYSNMQNSEYVNSPATLVDPSFNGGDVLLPKFELLRAQCIAKIYGYDKYKKSLEKNPSQRNLRNETLVGVLDGEILVHNHCYRADEMASMIDVAKEFGYKITAFHHGVEAYKIADLLADNGICGALWADWWGFKHEAYDMVQANIAIVDQARNGTGCAIVHSDDAIGIQHLNQEASKALSAGRRAGFEISEARAMKWITSNPARAAGIYDQTGSLKVGKNADVVVWSKNPFSVYALAEKVLIDGAIAYDREKNLLPASDFDIGITVSYTHLTLPTSDLV